MPGLYCIEGDIRINGASLLALDGVIIVLTDDDGTFDFNGNGELKIVAPDTTVIGNLNFLGGPFETLTEASEISKMIVSRQVV